MDLDIDSTLLEEAQSYFEQGRYDSAEPILNQMILQGQKSAFIFHMLGTILYDRGKFTKAIRSFRRALEVDPAFTDASIGLSIILNDLGKYEDGRKVFEEAQAMLAHRNKQTDSAVNEKFASKHDELGELYFRHQRYEEALDQYFKSLHLSSRKPEITMNIVECLLKVGRQKKAIELLRDLNFDYPGFHSARLRLAKLFYDEHRIPETVEICETVLSKDGDNIAAKELLDLALTVETTSIEEAAHV